jgi:hypothetical protein
MHVRGARGDDARALSGILDAIIREGGKATISRVPPDGIAKDFLASTKTKSRWPIRVPVAASA